MLCVIEDDPDFVSDDVSTQNLDFLGDLCWFSVFELSLPYHTFRRESLTSKTSSLPFA